MDRKFKVSLGRTRSKERTRCRRESIEWMRGPKLRLRDTVVEGQSTDTRDFTKTCRFFC